MNSDLMQQATTLMMVGMGTVFVFLTTLVIAMTLMAKVAGKLRTETPVADGVSADEVAAITAAIATHRKK